MNRPLDLNHRVELHSVTNSLFLARVMESGLGHVAADDWPTSARTVVGVGEPIVHASNLPGDSATAELDGVLVHVGLYGGRIYAQAAATEPEQVAAALRRLRELLPPPDPSAAHEVSITFWTYTRHGPQPAARTISVPGWDEIEANYASATRHGLDPLMRGFEPAQGGQLILWHGRAGTGKTFALRALAWEWREWCELHYIVDPDSFFGEHADYLMSVLLQPKYVFAPMTGLPGGIVETAGEQIEKSWRLLLLEDTGELLSADARERSGQGLSRFLNVVDGLIGQGLRVLVLVTTNEEIRALHPAVARPGRCAANVHFEPLSGREATSWLRERGLDETRDEPMLLASLYARAQGLPDGEIVQSPPFAELQ
jgi:hypothetical protein